MPVSDNQVTELVFAAWRAGRLRLLGELIALPPLRPLIARPPRTGAPQAAYIPMIGANAKTGAALARGIFTLAGSRRRYDKALEVWTRAAPSRRFAVLLHEFGWLHDMLAAGGDAARPLIADHMDAWQRTYGRWNAFSWEPGITARRCLNWLRVGQPALDDSMSGKSRRRCLMAQIAWLDTIGALAAQPRARVQIALALAAAGLLLPGAGRYAGRGLTLLATELDEQILPDGGHVSRSPEAAASILCDLVALRRLMDASLRAMPPAVERALRRLAPMVRFLSAADGALGVFNGGGEAKRLVVKPLLQHLGIPQETFQVAPHSGYQRVQGVHSTLIMDTGRAPPLRHSHEAHAGALAIEISTPSGRLIVNCGWSADQPGHWRQPVRASAAHSTLTVNDASSAQICAPGLRSAFLGLQLRQGGAATAARCTENEGEGVRLEAAHGGYLHRYGLIHHRRILVRDGGSHIEGRDKLYRPLNAPGIPPRTLDCALRFHLHPDVHAALARDNSQALLVLPDGTGWQFCCASDAIALEDSVYLAAGAPPVRTLQVVIQRQVQPGAGRDSTQNLIRWSLKRIEHES